MAFDPYRRTQDIVRLMREWGGRVIKVDAKRFYVLAGSLPPITIGVGEFAQLAPYLAANGENEWRAR